MSPPWWWPRCERGFEMMGNHLVYVEDILFLFIFLLLSSSVFFPTVELRVSLKFDEFLFMPP